MLLKAGRPPASQKPLPKGHPTELRDARRLHNDIASVAVFKTNSRMLRDWVSLKRIDFEGLAVIMGQLDFDASCPFPECPPSQSLEEFGDGQE